ncbi:MAG: thioredoxin-disulfide reductase [Lentisphaerae bacterium]|nr:thioredoxin-disulfide reductase [Lentisphaerota bacterium]
METIIILGSGPAGLTAAIYAARAGLKPLVVEGMHPGGQLTDTTDIENFPGFAEPLGGTDLMDRMHRQAERLGVRFMLDEAGAVRLAADDALPPAERVHEVTLAMAGDKLETRALIIATGASARYLGLPSEKLLIGHGVSGCATCDGAFFRGQAVAVVGGGDTALEDALYLSRLAASVTIIHRRDAFRASKIMADRVLANPAITVCWDHVVEEVLDPAANTVTGVRVRHVKTGAVSLLPVQGLFIAIGHTPNTAMVKDGLELDPNGYIVTDQTRTRVPGVFAAGDVQDHRYRQAVTAAGSGCMAALEAERYIGTLGV